MPDKRVHLKFDEKLKEKEIIYDDTDGFTVHDRMDREASYHGHWQHKEIDYYHDIVGIRDWIRKTCTNASQETSTDYVRICYGHWVLDDMEKRHPDKNEDDLINLAYRVFKQEKYDKTFYKEY
jgi:hypothetical protein